MFSARIRRSALCLALLGAFGASAHALQLGETKEQLLARHGQPGAEDHAKHIAVYFWEGWSAQIEFGGNVVRKITYRRNYYLQDAEITSLLNSNGGSGHWRETSTADGLARQWSRDDGASATCPRVRPTNIVFQATGLAAAYQQGPKVVAPGTPNPSAPNIVAATAPTSNLLSSKTAAYPHQLAAFPEPDLPVADPPPPTPGPVSSATTPAPAEPAHALPKLTATELDAKTKATASESVGASASATGELKPDNSASSLPAAAPVIAQPAVNASSPLPYLAGALVFFSVLGGCVFFFWKRQQNSPNPKRTSFRVVESTVHSLNAGPDFNVVRKDQVEILVGEIFRREGYAVELSAALNTDDNIDLMLRRDSETTLVQCKHWQAVRVTGREVREFYGALAAGGAPHGILVTTGTFTHDATEFAEGKGIELMDRSALVTRLASVAKPGEDFCAVSPWIDEFLAQARIFDPECPVCQTTMVIRHNRANGNPSWSCRSYPRCPGRREPRLDLLPVATH